MAKATTKKGATAEAADRRSKRQAALRAASEAGSSLYPDLTYAGNIIPMGGGYLGNIALINWARCAAIVQKQYDQIAISHRLHNLIRDHTISLGCSITANVKDPDLNGYKQCLNEIVTRTYSGHENRMDLKMGAYLLEASMFGELCLTAGVNPHNGKLKVGYMPVRWIEKVNPDPFDPSEPDSIVLRGGVEWINDKRNKEGGRIDFLGEASTRKVIRYNGERWKYDLNGKILEEKDEMGIKRKVRNPTFGKLDGKVFYSRLPNLLSVDRGRGDTFACADWINKLDQGIYDFLDRYNTQAAIVFDLLIKGGTADDIEKASKMRLPTGNRPYAHNEMQVLTLLSANIKIEDLTNFIRTLVVLIAGTVGVPEMMLSDGSQTNVATAQEQTPALYALFDNRRAWMQSFMDTVMRYALECANEADVIYYIDEGGVKHKQKLTNEQLDEVIISTNFVPYARSNTQALSKVLGEVVTAVMQMVQAKLISQKSGRTVARAFLSQLGTEIDNDAEDNQIDAEEEAAARATMPATTPSGNAADHQDLISAGTPIQDVRPTAEGSLGKVTPITTTAAKAAAEAMADNPMVHDAFKDAMRMIAEGAAGSGRIGGRIVKQSDKTVKSAPLQTRLNTLRMKYPGYTVHPMSFSERESRFLIAPHDKTAVIAMRKQKKFKQGVKI